MSELTPTNSLEIRLRSLILDKHTPVWSFFTPLAAAQLFIVTRHYPELDGSELVAPAGRNPEVCVLSSNNKSYIGIYTSAGRAREAMSRLKLSQKEYTFISAKGWPLLKFLEEFDAYPCMNLGVKEWQYMLDPDLVEILLSRPEPPDPEPAGPGVILAPEEGAPAFLAPLHDYLARQPRVRAAWVFHQSPSDNTPRYEVGLLTIDPEDDDTLKAVGTVVRAITPLQVECSVMMLMADDQSFINLSKQQPPFYAADGFLESHAGS
ncbi:MAG TPA: enhanced serine sensitivity protein SseB C-terminal domain-containing protein [Chthoniobacteraceae bacterium]|jgi:hypothetical protein|nr:enhanced serine sensitivity protein SseB C-terminal domain-containing protein [Chthoniobacteraceae bacterium]